MVNNDHINRLMLYTGWWLTYPSEKYESQLGVRSIVPKIWNNKKCSKPPTRRE